MPVVGPGLFENLTPVSSQKQHRPRGNLGQGAETGDISAHCVPLPSFNITVPKIFSAPTYVAVLFSAPSA